MYIASKAALTQASETWRLEFEPLGVRVITVVMGLVKSEFFSAYEADVKLLDNSYYTPAKPMLDKMMKPEPSFLQISAEEYAERVANDIEKGRTGKIWVGGLTTIIRFWGWLFRGWFLVSVIFFGLSLRGDTFEKTLLTWRPSYLTGLSSPLANTRCFSHSSRVSEGVVDGVG